MSNLYLNIRFGNYHFQVGDPHWYSIRWVFNGAHIKNLKRFEVYQFFNLV